MLDIGDAALGGVVAFFAARQFRARFADGLERDARRFVGFGKIGFRRGEPVGGGAALAGRGLDLADQRLALAFEPLRCAFELGALGRRLVVALDDDVDLRRRIVLALAPGLPLNDDGLQPRIGQFDFTGDRLRFDANLGADIALGARSLR